jgi:hypothetical protein
MRRLNQKGVSLIELIAGIPLATLLFAALLMGMLHFIKTYQETRLFLRLQDELFQAIQYMRYGYAHEPETATEGYIGLMTAKKASISQTGKSITIYPLLVDQTYAATYWSRFSVNDENLLVVQSQYGNSKYISPIVIFPKTKFTEIQQPEKIKRFGQEPQFKILNPSTIWTVEKTDINGEPLMIRIKLEGQVRYRARQEGQSLADDKLKNTRSIVYETSVYLGNTGSN